MSKSEVHLQLKFNRTWYSHLRC